MLVVGSLIALSNGAEKFVVYGRLVRQVIPFLVLVAAWAAGRATAGDRPATAGLVAVVLILAGWNQGKALALRWDFYARAQQLRLATIGQPILPGGRAVHTLQIEFVMQGYIWPEPKVFKLAPHRVLLEGAHPLQYRPFLYEGFNRQQRAAILGSDVTDKLILLDEMPTLPRPDPRVGD